MTDQEYQRQIAVAFRQVHPELVRPFKPLFLDGAKWREIPVDENGNVGEPRPVLNGDTVTTGNLLEYVIGDHEPGWRVILPNYDDDGVFADNEIETAMAFLFAWMEDKSCTP